MGNVGSSSGALPPALPSSSDDLLSVLYPDHDKEKDPGTRVLHHLAVRKFQDWHFVACYRRVLEGQNAELDENALIKLRAAVPREPGEAKKCYRLRRELTLTRFAYWHLLKL